MPVDKKKSRKKVSAIISEQNYMLFGLAALLLLVGYWALSQPPVDGFVTLTVAPILLVIGYCVVIPLAIMRTRKDE
jgi:hypothetical protein